MKKTINLLFAAFMLLFSSAAVMAGNAGASKHMGIAFYSVKGMESDMETSLKSVANDGYVVAEASNYNAEAGLFGTYSPLDYVNIAEEYGLDVISSHVRATLDINDEAGSIAAWKDVFEKHKAAGFKYVILPSNNWETTLSGVKAQCELMNKIGAEANKLGLKFGFHNHSGEFETIGNTDQIIEDYLIANTDADKVFFQMDVYWVSQGGQDPVAYLKKYPNRFQVLHIKDEYVIGASGDLDYKAIFEQFYKNGYQDWFVEIEEQRTPEQMAQMRAMMEEMQKAREEGREFTPAGGFGGFGGNQDPAAQAERLQKSLDAISESADFLGNSSFVR